MRKSFSFEGIDTYIVQLKQITDDTERLIKKAIYDGAKVGADELAKNIDSIPVSHEFGGITEDMVAGLRESFGITKLKNDDGIWNVKLGFDGYNPRIKKRPDGDGNWIPNEEGIPNQYVANIIEKGNAYHRPHKFTKIKSDPIEDAMKKSIDTELQKLTK